MTPRNAAHASTPRQTNHAMTPGPAGRSLEGNLSAANQSEEWRREETVAPQVGSLAEALEEEGPAMPAEIANKPEIPNHVVVVKQRSWCYCF